MPKSGRATIRDVAEAAGVGIATVDRVLNRRAPVSETATRQVFEAARAVGYHAASLVQKRLEERVGERRLGFLLQRRSESFYRALGEDLARAALAMAGRPALVEHLDDLAPARVAEALLRLAAQADAVALVAADHPRISEAVESLRAAGKPVFALLSDISAPSRTGFVGIDHRRAGRTAAWAIARLASAPGPVGLLIGNHRYLGHELCEISFRSYFREHAPAFQVLDALMSLEDVRLAHEATGELLRRHGDLAGIYVAGGGMEGVIEALREHGGYGEIVVVCNELIPETRAALMDGVVDLVIGTPVTLLADRTVEAMLAALGGRPADPVPLLHLPFQLYVSENI